MAGKMISIRVSLDGVGEETFKGQKLDKKEAIKKFFSKHNITKKDIPSLRHYPRARLVSNASSKN